MTAILDLVSIARDCETEGRMDDAESIMAEVDGELAVLVRRTYRWRFGIFGRSLPSLREDLRRAAYPEWQRARERGPVASVANLSSIYKQVYRPVGLDEVFVNPTIYSQLQKFFRPMTVTPRMRVARMLTRALAEVGT